MGLTPIARIDLVPYQRVTADVVIGVPAFSKDGIHDVTFVFNLGEAGEATVVATETSLNPDSGVWEYSGTLDVSEFPDGNLTIDATVTGDGFGADLLRGYVLSAAAGSYAIAGSDATLTYTPAGDYKLDADAGAYAVTGPAASLLYGRVLDATAGSYAVTGTDADLLYGRVLAAASGAYAITGTDADLLRGYVLAALAGSYLITGTDVTLTYSGTVADGGLMQGELYVAASLAASLYTKATLEGVLE